MTSKFYLAHRILSAGTDKERNTNIGVEFISFSAKNYTYITDDFYLHFVHHKATFGKFTNVQSIGI